MSLIKPLILTILICLRASFCLAWEGFDYQSCHYIDIYRRDGKEIEYFDYSDGKYHRGEILNLQRGGDKLEVFEYETGKIRFFDMERE